MKIKATREGRVGIYIPEKDSLKAWIKAKKCKVIHNFMPSYNIILGADHAVKSVLEDIENADRLAICTKESGSANMGHELAVIKGEKLELFDIGAITDNDLQLTCQPT